MFEIVAVSGEMRYSLAQLLFCPKELSKTCLNYFIIRTQLTE